MIDLGSRIEAIDEELSRLKEQEARIKGAISQDKKRLKKEFKCSTLKRAKTVLTKLIDEHAQITNELEENLKKLEEELDL